MKLHITKEWLGFIDDCLIGRLPEKELRVKYKKSGFVKSGYKPYTLSEFIGQRSTVEDLKVHIEAAKQNERALGHVALFGPPGLGKTTLARIVASEMEANFQELTGHTINEKRIENLLFSMSDREVIFVDEIHTVRRRAAELLYSPMQDFVYEGFILPEFTLIGATTNLGKLPKPMIDRMLHRYDFRLYSIEELTAMLEKFDIHHKLARFIAERSKGVPRNATNFLSQIKNYAGKAKSETLTMAHCREAFYSLGIDNYGLNRMDRNLLSFMANNKSLSPRSAIGVNSIIASLDLTEDIYLNMVEPHLLAIGFIQRTPRGRIISQRGLQYIQEMEKQI